MQYKPDSEKVAMTATAYAPVAQPLSLAEDRQVQRTRKIFLIILGVLLALAIIGLIFAIFDSGTGSGGVSTQRGTQIGQSLVSIIYYGFGIFVAYKYSTLGLRIFGWLGVVILVLEGIGIALLIFLAIVAVTAVAAASTGDSAIPAGVVAGAGVGAFIFIIVVAAAFVLTLIIVKFTFKLARLIDANKRLGGQQNV